MIFADCSKGEKLLRRFWNDMRDRKVECIKKYTSSKFQSVHYDGARNKKEELLLISKLNFSVYNLSEIKITKERNVYIMTYFVQVSETINDILFTAKTPRMTIFEKINGKWKLVAHANLNVPMV